MKRHRYLHRYLCVALYTLFDLPKSESKRWCVFCRMAQCLSHIRLRFIHCSQQLMSVDKTLLSKLRKKTGFPFNNCKKALEVQNNDFALVSKLRLY
jgi:hypothetical protein